MSEDTPILILKTKEKNHILTYDQTHVLGLDSEDFDAIIPVICNHCNAVTLLEDEFPRVETNEKSSGIESHYSIDTDYHCPKCDKSFHVGIDMYEYVGEFTFTNYENKDCKIIEIFGFEELISK